MKPSVRIAILALVVIAIGVIVALKYRDPQETVAALPPAATPATASREPVAPPGASVLLFADLSEASETEDACGVIIQTVRSARERGITVTEYDSGAAPDVRRQHRVVVEPTVIVLDAAGREIARHEGEDADTVTAVREDIERVSGGRA